MNSLRTILFLLAFMFKPSEAPISAPLREIFVSSGYGERIDPFSGKKSFHSGVDLRARIGEPIRAVGYGRVVFAGKYAGYGKLIVLEHARGMSSHYGHCAGIQVEVGQFVPAGGLIGSVGASGRATGPHLHFEIRRKGRALNPRILLENWGQGHGFGD